MTLPTSDEIAQSLLDSLAKKRFRKGIGRLLILDRRQLRKLCARDRVAESLLARIESRLREERVYFFRSPEFYLLAPYGALTSAGVGVVE